MPLSRLSLPSRRLLSIITLFLEGLLAGLYLFGFFWLPLSRSYRFLSPFVSLTPSPRHFPFFFNRVICCVDAADCYLRWTGVSGDTVHGGWC